MDTTPHDRPFAEVADRLALWQAVQDAATPGYFTRAWYRAGFHLFYVAGLPYPTTSSPQADRLSSGLLPIVFLPRWAEESTAAYRDAILKAFVRQWEAEGRADIIARFWDGLTLVLADELARHGPPHPA